MKKYKDWWIMDTKPEGWIIDKTVGSPLANAVFITNNKSVLRGQKRALLRVTPKKYVFVSKKDTPIIETKQDIETSADVIFPAKSVNTLARLKFKEHLLKDINFDLMVCEIEGWSQREYITEIRRLINSIKLPPKTCKNKQTNQLTLFNEE